MGSSSSCCEAEHTGESVATIEALRRYATRTDDDERMAKNSFPRSLTSDSTTGTGEPSVDDGHADGRRSTGELSVGKASFRTWQIDLEMGELDWSIGADVRETTYDMPFLTIREIMPDGLLEKHNASNPALAALKGDRIVAINDCNEGARDLIHAMRSARNLKLTLERGRAVEDADKGASDEQDFPMPPP
jgi:hypothetical protein